MAPSLRRLRRGSHAARRFARSRRSATLAPRTLARRSAASASLALAAALALGSLAGCAGTRKGAPTTPPPTAPPSPPAAPAPEPVSTAWKTTSSIKVGLAVGESKLLVAGSTRWKLEVLRGSEIARVAGGSALSVRRLGAEAIEVLSDGEPAPLWSGGAQDTLVLTPSDNGYSGWGGHWYRGAFQIYVSQSDGLTLVNEVDLESYLRSVLPNEIGTPPKSDYEAVKAQAVAARSYTLSYLGRRSALGFDLFASVEDQVYGGIGKENEQSDRALAATRGQVLVSEGAPIRALYSSTCGMRTANVEDVWPWPWTGYLRSVRDSEAEGAAPYCSNSPNFRWREEWSTGAFMTMLRQYGPAEAGAGATFAGDLLDVRVRERSRCGRVAELAVTTTKGDWVVRGDRVRWALRRMPSGAILRSSFLKIGVARDASGKPVSVIATGAGNGHGIGLCQWGAMGMARAGQDYPTILRHYYKDTSLARI